jgi:hypothetical protein
VVLHLPPHTGISEVHHHTWSDHSFLMVESDLEDLPSSKLKNKKPLLLFCLLLQYFFSLKI